MNRFAFILLISFLAFTFSPVHSALIDVPADFPTIQEAVDAASDGDSIVVGPGTYVETIDFLGKAIVVRSDEGPAVTTINGNRSGSVVTFRTGEGSGSVLEGFTITNGSGTQSGPYTYGGGIYCWFSTPTIKGNVITMNSATYHGGGIYCLSADSSLITGNVICFNRAHNGGGIYCSAESSPAITGTVMYGNSAELDGGGIYCNWDSNPTIAMSTIAANTAVYGGGGLYCYGSSPRVTSSVLYGNHAPEGPEAYLGDWLYPSTLTIDYSDVEGGEASVLIEAQCTLDWGVGMIESDPSFVLPGVHDYRLLWVSPCIDSGEPDSSDADGTRSDMGAYAFDQNDFLTLYLTPDAARVPQGGGLGVTFALINRHEDLEDAWLLVKIVLPGGEEQIIYGPHHVALPAEYTGIFSVVHDIPPDTPVGGYQFWAGVGILPQTLYDHDVFHLEVTRYPVIRAVPVEW